MSGNTVIIKRLNAEHGQASFKDYLPLNREMVNEIERNVKEIFDELGGASLLKSSGDVYIKPNGVGPQPYAFTRPEVMEAAIRYWLDAGARKVYLFENSSQAILTRTVFEMAGYLKVCKLTGAIPVYMDEEGTVPYMFTGKGPVSESEPDGYELTSFGMPRIVAEKLIEKKDENLYVSIPKLKTHTMTGVTLGIKNQWGFPHHTDRITDHNYNLQSKIVDVLSYVRPDVTLIEGVEGTIYGHFPPIFIVEKCIRPFKVLIGGLNVVAVDIVGAKIFGMDIDDVKHIRLAIERGLGGGVSSARDVELVGDFTDIQNLDILGELPKYGGKYPSGLYPDLSDNIVFIFGKELACKDGCYTTAVGGAQSLSFDYGGKGNWTLVLGKGFDNEQIEKLSGPVLVAGKCAVNEVGEMLVKRLGKRKVYLVSGCNDITSMMEALCHVMKVSPLKMAAGLNPIKGLELIIRAKLNHSTGLQVHPFSNFIKMR